MCRGGEIAAAGAVGTGEPRLAQPGGIRGRSHPGGVVVIDAGVLGGVVEGPVPRELPIIAVFGLPAEFPEIFLAAQRNVFQVIAGVYRQDGPFHAAVTPVKFLLRVPV
jgi:hypothetical protein